MIYGASGIGKSTLAALAPNPVFVGIDDGAKRIVHPVTGEKVEKIPGVQTFDDMIAVLRQGGLFKEGDTVVIDTITKLDEILIPAHIVANTALKGGGSANSFRQFGWDGHSFAHERMQDIIVALDDLIAKGVNVILLAQQDHKKEPNAEGADYIAASPRLRSVQTGNVRDTLVEWCDFVFRIGYENMSVTKDKSEKAGKVQNTDTSRAIFSTGASWFVAKSRQPNLPEVIDFAAPNDNLVWHYVFGQDLLYNPDEGDE